MSLPVQIALVCLFLQLNLDFLCAIRTPPYNSWKNPAERIMSLLNIALQGTGVVSSVTTFEDNLKSCNNLRRQYVALIFQLTFKVVNNLLVTSFIKK